MSPEQSHLYMCKSQELILLKIWTCMDILERNLNFAANGMWTILVSKNNKTTDEGVESLQCCYFCGDYFQQFSSLYL